MNCKIQYVLLFTIALCLGSCHKSDDWSGDISGKAQKGPFINGTSISVYELDDQLNQTGKNFNTQIENNTGTFNLSGVSLVSSIVLMRVDGFYFNEVCGMLSESQITLNGVVDASQANSFNLNVLTHLEKDRINTLVNGGSSFADAKSQAQSEILNVFGITSTSGINNSELLDMAGNSDGDAIMIAISCILQGHRDESGLSAILADFITDFRGDGELNDTSLVYDLILHAQSLNLPQIRSNIEDWYADLGINVTVPDFESHVGNFLAVNAPVANQSVIEYGEFGEFGWNVLYLNRTVFESGNLYSFAANMPDACMDVRIKMTKISGPDCGSGCWWFWPSTSVNWINVSYDSATDSQFFNSAGKDCELRIGFHPGIVLFEYFEGGSQTPSRTKLAEFL